MLFTISNCYTVATSSGPGFATYYATTPTLNNNYFIQNSTTTDSLITYTTCDNNITGNNARGSRCTSAQLASPNNTNWSFAGWDYSGGLNFNGSIWVAPTNGGACGTSGVNVCPSANYPYPTLRL